MASITAGAIVKLTAAIGTVGVALPAMFWSYLPTGEDLKDRYPGDRQSHRVQAAERNAKIFDDHVMKLREYAKDDRNIWIVMAEAEKKKREEYKRFDRRKQQLAAEALAERRGQIRRELSGEA